MNVIARADRLRREAVAKGRTSGVLKPLSMIGGDIEFKLEFLISILPNMNVRSINSYISIFNLIAKEEKIHGKDLYSFEFKDMVRLTASISNLSNSFIVQLRSTVNKYLTYAKDKGKCKYVIIIKPKMITFRSMAKYISVEEYNILLDNAINYQDKALYILLWNGLFSPSLKEIRTLTEHDIHSVDGINYIRVNEKSIYISKYEYSVLGKALNETIYRGEDYKTTLTLPLDSEYLLKKSGKANTPVSKVHLYTRLKNSSTGIFPNITLKSLFLSGLHNKYKRFNFGDYIEEFKKEGVGVKTAEIIKRAISNT